MSVQPDGYFPIRWRKSRHSADQGNCVEVASLPASVLIRDSRAAAGPIIMITSIQWAKFLLSIRGKGSGFRP